MSADDCGAGTRDETLTAAAWEAKNSRVWRYQGMHLAITPNLIYILDRPRRLQLLLNEICSWFFTVRLSAQVRLLSNFYTSFTVF